MQQAGVLFVVEQRPAVTVRKAPAVAAAGRGALRVCRCCRWRAVPLSWRGWQRTALQGGPELSRGTCVRPRRRGLAVSWAWRLRRRPRAAGRPIFLRGRDRSADPTRQEELGIRLAIGRAACGVRGRKASSHVLHHEGKTDALRAGALLAWQCATRGRV